MYDESYNNIFSSRFEVYSLLIASFVHSPLIFIFPWSYATLIASLSIYYFVHRKSHIDVEWGKKWIPWHYAHHMNKDQHKNWGVRLPIVDMVFKTSDYN